MGIIENIGRKLIETLYSELFESGFVEISNGRTDVSVLGKNGYSAVRGNWKHYGR